jgi:hypothetical protein
MQNVLKILRMKIFQELENAVKFFSYAKDTCGTNRSSTKKNCAIWTSSKRTGEKKILLSAYTRPTK